MQASTYMGACISTFPNRVLLCDGVRVIVTLPKSSAKHSRFSQAVIGDVSAIVAMFSLMRGKLALVAVQLVERWKIRISVFPDIVQLPVARCSSGRVTRQLQSAPAL
jgi:hypothetical protein